MQNHFLKEMVLETLADAGTITREVFFTGYAASYRNARRMMLHGVSAHRVDTKAKMSFANTLSKLRREGLVEQSKRHSGAWSITAKGKAWLAAHRGKRLPQFAPTAEKDYLKIVIFDIPELHKAKRQWLRNTIAGLGFSMLQKSVWIGEQKLPVGFMEDLNALGLESYVHIFAVAKRGTIL
ncbi:MAG: hypothetical protein A3G64_02285 [Candidatus Liptonbacteria bacterium RIFCSPLOWO2_12_FULL_60_15]|uniref:Transcriptional repressor PaaX-like central Cas2-like domain-containing protein n=2 Tax=Candidatus Liptoniibacteriota TaxID=1817909 RepID=A0A1G2CML1_9BACT|nr:MAG: hypothetical protein A3G64_02285 [Candidatus Liptonbacteria bacterium RIFCSPLOWO2_12_FULL_60_15]